MKRILVKVSGEIMKGSVPSPSSDKNSSLSPVLINHLVEQVKKLTDVCSFHFLIGGGNFFRGSQQGKIMGLTPTVADDIGMMATTMNALMLSDLLHQGGIEAIVMSPLAGMPSTTYATSNEIAHALQAKKTIIFAGGTGLPFFTTDTAAVVRSLQIKADELWKGTKVDGLYSADPLTSAHAQKIPLLSYAKVVEQQLQIMDLPAIQLAQVHSLRIKVFTIFEHNALVRAYQDPHFGSIIE
jgi:uridylate kinase